MFIKMRNNAFSEHVFPFGRITYNLMATDDIQPATMS